MSAVYIALFFGLLGYIMRKLDISILPFVIAYILANNLETPIRQSFEVLGGDPYFFFKSPIAMIFFAMIGLVIYFFGYRQKKREKLAQEREAAASGTGE